MKRYLNWVPVALLAVTVSAFTSGIIQSLLPARADQSERVPPTSGIYTGPQFSALLGDAFRSVSTANKGSVAPANVGGSAVDGMEWIDDSATPWIKKRYVNGGWAVEGALDPTDSSYAGVIGGGITSITSASTTELGSVPQANVSITGTTTISSFGSSAKSGVVKIIRFADALTLTYSSALTVPGGYDLTTAANDRAIVTHLGSGNWEVTQYTRSSGIPVDISRVGKPSYDFSVSLSPLEVAGYGQALTRAAYPAYFAKVTRAQNGTRTSGNATITSVADTSGLGAGMPIESTGVSAGCTIASVVANTSITLNSSSCVTSSGTSTVTVFPYGYGTGGSSTTVGVPDCRNRSFAGRDRSDPGSLANRLTTSYFGANSGIFGAVGGFESHTLLAAEMASHTHGVSGTTAVENQNHTHNTLQPVLTNATAPPGSGGSGNLWSGQGSIASGVPSVGHTHNFNVTSASSGSDTPHAIVPPTLIAECVVRVIP